MTPISPVIRDATAADVRTITAIYNEQGVGTTASYDLEPVDDANRLIWLVEHQREGCVIVAEVDGQVVGFAGYGKFRTKPGYDHTMEHSVYVAHGHEGLHLGRTLMLALVVRARANRVHLLVGVLDADNTASRDFHTSLGFVETGVLPQVGRKFGRWLDAVFTVLQLD